MAKKRKMIEIEDLLDQQPDPTSNDMVFITATEERKPSQIEEVHMNRLERIRSTAVKVEEPLFDGETDLDMGLVKIGSEDDAHQIKKELLEQKQIAKASDKNVETAVKEMRGSEPEDVVEDLNLDIPTVPIDVDEFERKQIKKVNNKAVQEILDDLHKRR